MYKILKAETLAAKIHLMVVHAPRVASHCLPGQFIIVKLDEKGERIPLTICDYDREAGTVTIVFQEIGASTIKMSALKAGDSFRDFVGPLGCPSEFVHEDIEELKKKEVEREIASMRPFDITAPSNIVKGSYHPITLVQRQCEAIFKSMGFTVEDYSEIVTDYECFESLNIPKHHPARDMQDTYYLDNGQLLKSQTSAAQNAILKKYGKNLIENGVPIKAIFPGRCFRNEATDACHENTFFQMEGVMVDKNISISNLIFFMKTMLSEVFQKDINVRLRPGFFPFVEPGFELDISCLICGGEGCPSCKHSGWLELCPCGMIHPNVLREGGIDPDEYTGFAFGLGLTRLAMMKYGIKDIRDLNSGSLKALSQFTDDK